MRRALLILTLVTAPAHAQLPPGEIVVTGRGLPPALGSEAFGSVTLDADRLADRASTHLESALGDIAGFQQFRRSDSRSANPTSQGITFRGLGGNAASRALVLLDGVPQDDPFAGYLPFAALRSDRLSGARITRGGGAGAFGTGALAGTIELFSRTRGTLLGGFGGSRTAVELSGVTSARLGSGTLTADASLDRGDGFFIVPAEQRGPADRRVRYRSVSGGLRAVVPIGSGEVQTSLRLFDDRRERGLAGTETSTSGADFALRYVGLGRWPVEALAYLQLRDFAAGFASVDARRAVVTPTLDQYGTPALGLGGKLELRAPIANLRLGADIRRFSGETNERFRYSAGQPTALRRAGGVNTVVGGYVEASERFGPATLLGGARLDHYRVARGFLTERTLASGAVTKDLRPVAPSGTLATARAGLQVALAPSLSARAAAYRGFRLPTLNELYRPFRLGADAVAANPALEPERLDGGEAGFDYRTPRLSLSATLFANRLRDAIANVTLAQGPGSLPQVGFVAGAFRQRLNLRAIRSHGVELTAAARLGRLELDASYAHATAQVRASGSAAPLAGLRPAQTPRHQASVTGRLVTAPLTLAATARYASGQFEDDLNQRRLPAAFTVDGFAAFRLAPRVQLVTRAENVFDERVVAGVAPTGVLDLATPRVLWLGLRFGN